MTLPRSAAEHLSRRDLWLSLARAFAPPAGADYLRAFAQDLPSDLAAIGDELGLSLGPEAEAFRQAAAGLPDALDLQKLYAALFLTPPAPASLNTALYLDGAVMGRSEMALEDLYARHGFQRAEGFRDLNDTVAVQCEFLGRLHERAAAHARAAEDVEAAAYAAEIDRFAADHLRRWATPFLGDLERVSATHGVNPAFAHLARVLWLAVEGAVDAAAPRLDARAAAALPSGSSRGIGALTAVDLAEIAWRLERDGLAFDHVAKLPEWDDAAFAARRARGDATEAADATAG